MYDLLNLFSMYDCTYSWIGVPQVIAITMAGYLSYCMLLIVDVGQITMIRRSEGR